VTPMPNIKFHIELRIELHHAHQLVSVFHREDPEAKHRYYQFYVIKHDGELAWINDVTRQVAMLLNCEVAEPEHYAEAMDCGDMTPTEVWSKVHRKVGVELNDDLIAEM